MKLFILLTWTIKETTSSSTTWGLVQDFVRDCICNERYRDFDLVMRSTIAGIKQLSSEFELAYRLRQLGLSINTSSSSAITSIAKERFRTLRLSKIFDFVEILCQSSTFTTLADEVSGQKVDMHVVDIIRTLSPWYDSFQRHYDQYTRVPFYRGNYTQSTSGGPEFPENSVDYTLPASCTAGEISLEQLNYSHPIPPAVPQSPNNPFDEAYYLQLLSRAEPSEVSADCTQQTSSTPGEIPLEQLNYSQPICPATPGVPGIPFDQVNHSNNRVYCDTSQISGMRT